MKKKLFFFLLMQILWPAFSFAGFFLEKNSPVQQGLLTELHPSSITFFQTNSLKTLPLNDIVYYSPLDKAPAIPPLPALSSSSTQLFYTLSGQWHEGTILRLDDQILFLQQSDGLKSFPLSSLSLVIFQPRLLDINARILSDNNSKHPRSKNSDFKTSDAPDSLYFSLTYGTLPAWGFLLDSTKEKPQSSKVVQLQFAFPLDYNWIIGIGVDSFLFKFNDTDYSYYSGAYMATQRETYPSGYVFLRYAFNSPDSGLFLEFGLGQAFLGEDDFNFIVKGGAGYHLPINYFFKSLIIGTQTFFMYFNHPYQKEGIWGFAIYMGTLF